MKLVEGTTY